MNETPSPKVREAWLRARVADSGHPLDPTPLALAGRGFDNTVLTGYTLDGRAVVIKYRRRGRPPHYHVASWASHQLTRVGVPVPRILWHDDELCLETATPGRPAGSHRPVSVTAAGAVLRTVHTVGVDGFGRLDTYGRGPQRSLADWLTSRTPADDLRDVPHTETLGQRVNGAVRELATGIAAAEPWLLHGDWVARHVLTVGDQVSGVIDLESVRGGDPMADLAGWSLQEPAESTTAFFDGYGLDINDSVLLRLLAHRLRIATALAGHHHRHGDPARAELHLLQLRADLDDLDAGRVRAVPALTPPMTSHPTGALP